MTREHRKKLAARLGGAETEIRYVDIAHSKDPKNYHAWLHRKWVCEHFKLFESEKEAVEAYITKDEMNNSAWVYRHFLHNRTTLDKIGDDQFIRKEIQYVKSKLDLNPVNEAPWSYINSYWTRTNPDTSITWTPL